MKNIPIAPTPEELQIEKSDNQDQKLIPVGCSVSYRCPYCGHLMYYNNMVNGLRERHICVHCKYTFDRDMHSMDYRCDPITPNTSSDWNPITQKDWWTQDFIIPMQVEQSEHIEDTVAFLIYSR